MESVHLTSPWLLALLAPVWAVILWVGLRPEGRRAGAAGRTVLACLATALLVTALAGPQVRVSREGLTPVFILQDASPSMRPGGPAQARTAGPHPSPADVLAPYAAALPSGHAGLVRFDGQAVVLAEPFTPEAARLARPDTFPPDTSAGGAVAETNIQAAIEEASRAMPGGRGVVLLYTDALETQGDAVRAAAKAAAAGIQVHAVVPPLAPRDVGIVSVRLASEPRPGGPVSIEVRLRSTVAARATIRLERSAAGGEPSLVGQRELEVDPVAGAALVFEDTPPAAGLYHYRADVASPADDWPENDRASCLARVGDEQEVIYIFGDATRPPSGRPGALEWLRAKAPPNVRIRAVPASMFRLPASGGGAVILDNVSAWSLGEDAARQLAARVTDGGLGLLALGGDAAFAAGGYADSPLEQLLPVTSKPAKHRPLELVLVMDSSGSMNEIVDGLTKLAVAKYAALDLRAALAEADRVGVVVFAGEPRVVSPLAPLSAWEGLRQRLLETEAGGGTRLTPALQAALRLFGPPEPAAKTVRHVLLLSDGRSADFDVPLLVAECGRAAVSVSVVVTGAEANRSLLGRLAAETHGRIYEMGDLARLRETFFKDAAWARGEGLRRQSLPAQWGRPEPIWRQAGPALPPVEAVNETRAKDGADVGWSAPPAAGEQDRRPLLASWRRGLGKAAAMPWPVSDAAGPWLAGDTLPNYLAAILGWLYAAPAPADWSARLVERDDAWWVRVEQRTGAMGRPGAPFVAGVFLADGSEAEQVTLEQVAPGIHEGRIGPRADRAAAIVVHRQAEESGAAAQGAEAVAYVSLPGLAPREFERFGVDRRRLEEIVRAGGGSIHDRPQSLAEVVRRTERRDFLPVGIYLVWAAGAVVVIQVALRLLGRL